jgi:DNA-binding transcriptional regulator YdaS (Cro superfamily)
MESKEFIDLRKNLNKTQQKMAQLMGISVKAVRSYEQGWRTIPAHAARQIMFLTAQKHEALAPREPCWIVKNCPDDMKTECPAWEFQAGTLCWFINGTLCCGNDCLSWDEKIKICRTCKAFPPALRNMPVVVK